MNLFIRNKNNKWITFIHDVQEFKELIEDYIPGRPLLLGDLSQFNKTMLNMCLKFVEDNPSIDIYSSEDISSPILLSRFVNVIKDPVIINESHSLDKFLESDKSYIATVSSLSRLSNSLKLRAPLIPANLIKIMANI